MYEFACLTGDCATSNAIVYLVESWSAGIGQNVTDVSAVVPWLWPSVFGVLGAIFASFSGVVVDRLPKMQGWGREPDPNTTLSTPASHCDHCQSTIPRQYLIPVVGWILSRGECRSCGQPVPPTYPIIEGASAFASFSIFGFFGPGWLAVSLCICLWVLILASWMDWRESEIPDFITIPLFFLGALCSPLDPDITSRLIGAVMAGGLTFAGLKLVSHLNRVDAMMYGDIALATALGAWLGTCSAPIFLGIACAVFAAYAFGARLRGQIWMQFGPALSIAFMIVALAGLRIT